MRLSSGTLRQQVTQLAVVFVPLALGLGFRSVLWRAEPLLLLFFRSAYCTMVLTTVLVPLVNFVRARARPSTATKRRGGWWIAAALLLLLIRVCCPSGYPFGVDDSTFAYDEGLGTWVWIAVHAIGYAVVIRLYRSRRPVLCVMFAITWTLATMVLLMNNAWGGDDLGLGWRT